MMPPMSLAVITTCACAAERLASKKINAKDLEIAALRMDVASLGRGAAL
jgi:hypothetical protein